MTHDSGTLAAKQVVLAAGAASGTLTKDLGYRFAIAAERGYHRHYALHPDSPPLTCPVLDTGAASIIAPMGPDRVRVLSGVELNARHAKPTIRRSRRRAGRRRKPCASAAPSTTSPGSARAPRPRTGCR